MPLECKILTNQENEKMTAGLGIKVELKNGALSVTKMLPDGQCAKGGVKLHSQIVGIDGKPLNECLKEVTADAFATEVKRRAESDAAPYVLNVDGFPDAVEDDGNGDFRKLLNTGLVTKKKQTHTVFTGGNIIDSIFNNGRATRVLYHDESDNKLKVVQKKGDKTQKAMKMTEVTDICVNEKNPKEMVIQSSNGVKVHLSCPSENATKAIVKKLHKSCSIEQESGGNVVLRQSQPSGP